MAQTAGDTVDKLIVYGALPYCDNGSRTNITRRRSSCDFRVGDCVRWTCSIRYSDQSRNISGVNHPETY
jgi:hypothetical protein